MRDKLARTWHDNIKRIMLGQPHNYEAASMEPLAISKTRLLGEEIRLVTHRQDQVLGAMLRGEIALCPHYQAELAWLKEQIGPDDFVLDAGANIGSISVALSLAQRSASICAFEPDPMNFGLLQTNLVLNGCRNVSAFNLALGNENGLINFFRSPDNFGDHRSSKPKGLSLRESEFEQVLTPVSKVRGSSFIGECFPERMFDLVKIDTQGADFEILADILPLLKTTAKVAIEFSPYHLETNGTSREVVLGVLQEFQTILKIKPASDSPYVLEQIDGDVLGRFYEAGRERYQSYLDLILLR